MHWVVFLTRNLPWNRRTSRALADRTALHDFKGQLTRLAPAILLFLIHPPSLPPFRRPSRWRPISQNWMFWCVSSTLVLSRPYADLSMKVVLYVLHFCVHPSLNMKLPPGWIYHRVDGLWGIEIWQKGVILVLVLLSMAYILFDRLEFVSLGYQVHAYIYRLLQVVGLTMFDLRRRGKVDELSMVGVNGSKYPAIRQHLEENIAQVYKDMDTTFVCFIISAILKLIQCLSTSFTGYPEVGKTDPDACELSRYQFYELFV